MLVFVSLWIIFKISGGFYISVLSSMPNKCGVVKCRGNYDTENKCRVFRLPRDQVEKQKWLSVLPPCKGFVVDPSKFFFCEKHWPSDTQMVKVPGGHTRPVDPPSIFNVPTCLPTPKPTNCVKHLCKMHFVGGNGPTQNFPDPTTADVSHVTATGRPRRNGRKRLCIEVDGSGDDLAENSPPPMPVDTSRVNATSKPNERLTNLHEETDDSEITVKLESNVDDYIGASSQTEVQAVHEEIKQEYMFTDAVYKDLVELAFDAKERAYCPYSNFPVGAAVLCDDGSIVTGCNVENASYGLSICAERTALVKAISEGHRKVQAIAVASNLERGYVAPCGACRQFIREFAGKNMDDCKVIVTKPDSSYQVRSIKELLPLDFGPEDLLDKIP